MLITRKHEGDSAPGKNDPELKRKKRGRFNDELFEEAGLCVIRSGKASIGHLQRAFKIGFNRAAKLLDELAGNGVIGPEQVTRPRDILMTEEMFADLFLKKVRKSKKTKKD